MMGLLIFSWGNIIISWNREGKKVIRYDYSPKHHMKNSIYESESHEPVLQVKGAGVKSLQPGIPGFSSSI